MGVARLGPHTHTHHTHHTHRGTAGDGSEEAGVACPVDSHVPLTPCQWDMQANGTCYTGMGRRGRGDTQGDLPGTGLEAPGDGAVVSEGQTRDPPGQINPRPGRPGAGHCAGMRSVQVWGKCRGTGL